MAPPLDHDMGHEGAEETEDASDDQRAEEPRPEQFGRASRTKLFDRERQPRTGEDPLSHLDRAEGQKRCGRRIRDVRGEIGRDLVEPEKPRRPDADRQMESVERQVPDQYADADRHRKLQRSRLLGQQVPPHPSQPARRGAELAGVVVLLGKVCALGIQRVRCYPPESDLATSNLSREVPRLHPAGLRVFEGP